MFRTPTFRAVFGAILLASIVAAFAFAAPQLSRSSAAAGDCTTNPALDADEQQFLTLINNYRQQNGLQPLGASYLLSKAAQWKSQDMGVERVLRARRPDAHVGAAHPRLRLRLQRLAW